MKGSKEMHIEYQDELMQSINETELGEKSHLATLVYLEEQRKYLETSLAIVKSFKDDFMDEIALEYKDFPDGYEGYEIEVRSGGRMYNYKNIPEWQEYKKFLSDCEQRYKQAFISKEQGLMVASEDGEEMLLPEVSYRKSSVVVKKKRAETT